MFDDILRIMGEARKVIEMNCPMVIFLSDVKRYVILMKDGSYYGQKWDGNTRSYPTWKTRKGAEKKCSQLKN